MPNPKNKYPYKALSSQFDYLRNLLSSHGFTKQLKSGKESLVTPTYRAYCFIFHEYTIRYKILQRDKEGWIQLQMGELNKRFKGWKPKKLVEAGLLIMHRQYVAGEQSFKYRIPEDILEGWVAARDWVLDYTNYFSGEPWSEADEIELWEELEKEWESYPSRMKQAADILQESYFNFSEVERHLERLRKTLRKLPTTHPLYAAKAGELMNDELCFSALLAMSPKPCEKRSEKSPNDEFLSFRPRYQPATTGRINMVGGALQSCTREMKLAAYGDLKGMNNYDLSSSQARILYHHEFEKYGIDCPWLKEYLDSPEKRKGYAEYVRLEDRVWKSCLSALMMGAHLPSNTNSRDNSILRILRKEVTTDTGELQGILGRLRKIVKPLLPALKQWHSLILEDLEQNGSMLNAIGTEIHRGKSYQKIAAHILQGAEAYFIQELTLLASKFGYQPIANEHDGLVVIGEIPAMAVEEVRAITKLSFMELKPKNTFGVWE